MANDDKHFFKNLLVIFISSFENCIKFTSLFIDWSGFLFNFYSSLYSLDINPLSDA